MQLEYLKEFRELCVNYQLNFSNAAEALHITQPALSNHIKQLENEIGAILIDRGRGHPSSLTPAGIVFLNHIGELLELLTNIITDCQNAVDQENAIVRILSPLFIPPIFYNIVNLFNESQSRQLDITRAVFTEESIHVNPLTALDNDCVDCCLASIVDGDNIPNDSTYSYILLPNSSEEILVWIDKNNSLTSQSTISRDNAGKLTSYVSTLFTSGMGQEWVNSIYKCLNSPPKYNMYYTNSINLSFINQFNDQDSVAFLPAYYCEQPVISQITTREFRSIDPPIFASLYVVFKKDVTREAVNKFKIFLQQQNI